MISTCWHLVVGCCVGCWVPVGLSGANVRDNHASPYNLRTIRSKIEIFTHDSRTIRSFNDSTFSPTTNIKQHEIDHDATSDGKNSTHTSKILTPNDTGLPYTINELLLVGGKGSCSVGGALVFGAWHDRGIAVVSKLHLHFEIHDFLLHMSTS